MEENVKDTQQTPPVDGQNMQSSTPPDIKNHEGKNQLHRIYAWVEKNEIKTKDVAWDIKGGDNEGKLFVELITGKDHKLNTRTVEKITLQGIESKREEGAPLIVKGWTVPSKVEEFTKQLIDYLTTHEVKA